MSFFSSFAEKLGIGRKPEVSQPTVPQLPIEEKKQDAANLEAMMSQGKDFRNPLDQQRLDQLRTEIAAAEPTPMIQTTPTPELTPTPQPEPQVLPQPQIETQPMQPTIVPEVPQEQPVEQPKAA